MTRLPFAIAIMAAIAFVALGGRHYVTVPSIVANALWLRHLAAQWRVLAPLLFVAANAGMLMVLVVPAWFCTIVGGLLFGTWLGFVYALVGTTLGAAGVFLAARGGLRGLTERAVPAAERVAAGFRTNALSYLIFLRLVPIFPFTLVNIAAALAQVPLRKYVFGTLLGVIPSVFIYASLGDVLLDMVREGRLPDGNMLVQARFLLPLLSLAVLALLPLIVRALRRSRDRR